MPVIILGLPFSTPCSLAPGKRSRTRRRSAALQCPEPDPLLDWLRASGLPAQKVVLSSAVPEGRGVIAEQAIRRGEALLQVPQRLLLTPDAALRDSSIGALLDRAGLPAWSVLAALLAELKLGQTSSRDRWGPYADALPAQTGCVLEWSADEIEMLRGTSLERTARDITSAAAVSWEELQPVLRDGYAKGLIPRDLLSREAFTWSFSTLLSRLVKLPGSSGVDACVPWADMLNHSPHVSAFFEYDAGTSSVVLRPDKAYRKGEQVYISYGQKTSGQLLLSYGFMPEAGSNPHDACMLELKLSADDPSFHSKVACLRQYGIEATNDFPLRLNALPQALLLFAAFRQAQTIDAAEVTSLGGQLFERGIFPVLRGCNLEFAAVDAVLAACRTAQANLRGSMDEDKDAIQQLVQQSSKHGMHADSQRHMNILQLRMQERRILNKTVSVLINRRRHICA